MPALYAIGDIHGQLGMLDDALALIEADGGVDAPVVFLGDYVDRGPDSRGVIVRLSEGLAQGRNWTVLKGNHDRLFEWFMQDEPRHDPHLLVGFHWFHEALGGIETLQSYGIAMPERIRLQDIHAVAKEIIPQAHVDFLKGLRIFHETDGKLFVHAGIRPGIALADQTEEDLVWIRQSFHRHEDRHPWLVVHGHTPVKAATHYGNRINLDSGAGYGKPLTVAVFEDDQVWTLGKRGRKRLKPV